MISFLRHWFPNQNVDHQWSKPSACLLLTEIVTLALNQAGSFFSSHKIVYARFSSTKNCYQLLSNTQIEWSQCYLTLIEKRGKHLKQQKNSNAKFPTHVTDKPTKDWTLLSHSMQLCLQMEKLRQHESIFIDITCISGTTIRTQELPRHTDINKHLASTSVCCSVAQLCLTLCDPKDCSPPGFPVLHHLPEFAQTHIHWVSDAIQPSRPLPSPSPPACYLSQHQGLFQWQCFPIRVSSV